MFLMQLFKPRNSNLLLVCVDISAECELFSIHRLFLPREELDNPHKPKTWNLYKEDFGVSMIFSE